MVGNEASGVLNKAKLATTGTMHATEPRVGRKLERECGTRNIQAGEPQPVTDCELWTAGKLGAKCIGHPAIPPRLQQGIEQELLFRAAADLPPVTIIVHVRGQVSPVTQCHDARAGMANITFANTIMHDKSRKPTEWFRTLRLLTLQGIYLMIDAVQVLYADIRHITSALWWI